MGLGPSESVLGHSPTPGSLARPWYHLRAATGRWSPSSRGELGLQGRATESLCLQPDLLPTCCVSSLPRASVSSPGGLRGLDPLPVPPVAPFLVCPRGWAPSQPRCSVHGCPPPALSLMSRHVFTQMGVDEGDRCGGWGGKENLDPGHRQSLPAWPPGGPVTVQLWPLTCPGSWTLPGPPASS